jgi:hypothetical protein
MQLAVSLVLSDTFGTPVTALLVVAFFPTVKFAIIAPPVFAASKDSISRQEPVLHVNLSWLAVLIAIQVLFARTA